MMVSFPSTVRRTLATALAMAGLAAFVVGCGDDGADAPSPMPTSLIATATPSIGPTAVPGAIDPCTLRPSLEGRPLVAGPSFTLDAQMVWQLCLGGAAAGSGEKWLFITTDGGVSWTLISRTTLGDPPPEAGAGDFPNGNGVVQILFLDETNGWLAMNSPGQNLFRSEDGGHSWTATPELPPGEPVTSISFTDALHGTAVTPDSAWTTTDGGDTWVQEP